MPLLETVGGPYKESIQVAEYIEGQFNRLITLESWFEGNGTLIIDEDRIAELEARIAECQSPPQEETPLPD